MKSEIILLLMSGVLLAVGTYLWQRGNHLIRHGKKTVARVFDNKEEYRKDSIYYYAIVEYITEDKKHLAHQLNIGHTTPTQIGTEMMVIYDPDDPTTVEVDSRTWLEIVPRVLVVAGICGLVFVLFEVFELTQLID